MQNEQTMINLRRAGRVVLKDFPLDCTLIPKDLTDPSRIEETKLARIYFQEDDNSDLYFKLIEESNFYR